MPDGGKRLRGAGGNRAMCLHFGLGKQGILGINARNLDYIFPSNPRKYYPLVDNKLLTKELAGRAGIASPELYAVIEWQEQIRHFEELIGDHDQFVIKPAQGSGGGGIMVIGGRDGKGFVKGSGAVISAADIRYHISNILSGLFSLGGGADKAIIEYRVHIAPLFKDIAYQGVPDIRLIIYRGVPVMAMLRVPTKESDGKANLHAGGIGIGISMKGGVTTGGIRRGQFIDRHNDTGARLDGIAIPAWRKMLELGSRFEEMIGLGYIGVDLVIDDDLGPMLLEVNARPGLAIQVANKSGLKPRLELVKKHIDTLRGTEAKVTFAVDNFA